jgi:hypothetical protein
VTGENKMNKSFSSIGVAILLFIAAKPQSERFLKYNAIEAYEVRPGVLVFPKYSENGNLCEIDLQRHKFSSEEIALDSLLSQDEIEEVADDLLPASERGRRLSDLSHTSWEGQTAVTYEEFENISIEIYSSLIIKSEDLPLKPGANIDVSDRVATIQWKQRKCQ